MMQKLGGAVKMGAEATPDFSGYATKAGLKCSDGRTITPDAFKHQDKETVPLVWQHGHNEPSNVLGYATLEHREDGVYCYGFFNDTEQAKNARTLVQHGDIKSLSIYANQLTEKAKQVLHGFIRELSLVLSGANPGALIDNVTLAHADGELVTLDDEAIIYTGLELHHGDGASSEKTEEKKEEIKEETKEETKEKVVHSEEDPTVQEVYDSMTPIQQQVVNYMVGAALETASKVVTEETEQSVKQSAVSDDEESTSELAHKDDEEEGRRMSRNVFEQENEGKKEEEHVLTHDAVRSIVDDARRSGSLKEAVEQYALKHGIDNIEVLFPDAKSVTETPEFDSRRVEWVSNVMNGTKHSPFSRIKSLVADLTFDEARARGYIKGNFKKEEWFAVSKRSTTPSTVYKKQKLDRDDIVDITDFDIVMWLKGEMRLMLDEELARAVLIGDGRDVDDEDKIKDPAGASEGAGVRSILHDHDLYVTTINVDDSAPPPDVVDAIISAGQYYKGSGSPTFYTTLPVLTSLLLARDTLGHRLWKTPAELASEMGVSSIVTVEVMESEANLLGIIVNLKDYTIGADKGGEVNFFDDFDIDYNQYKYLYETRISGALTKIRSAMVIMRAPTGATLVTPEQPDFDGTTVIVKTTPNVVYKDKSTGATLTTGAPVALAPGDSLTVIAVPAASYYFANNADDEWTFTNRV
jgi:HK97 family phage prohead protease